MNTLPTITTPSRLRVGENSESNPLAGLQVADADGDILTVTIAVSGLLDLGVTDGLTFTTGDGAGDSLLVFSGSVADLNAALGSLSYTPPAGFNGRETFNVSVADGGEGLTAGQFGSSLTRADFSGDNGFILTGTNTFDNFGIAVESIGDINNDGIDDLAIASRQNDGQVSNSPTSDVYVLFGSTDFDAGAIDIENLDGSDGFIFRSNEDGDGFGIEVAALGDIDGDGVADFAVTASSTDRGLDVNEGPVNAGAVHVVLGGTDVGSDGLITAQSLLADGNGFSLFGSATLRQIGSDLSGTGDINGDGFDDFVISQRFQAGQDVTTGVGRATVVFGSEDLGAANIDLSNLSTLDGFIIEGVSENDQLAQDASNIGDVNGDGIDDLLLSTPATDTSTDSSVGTAYLVFGSTDLGEGGSFDLTTLDGTNGIAFLGVDSSDFAGFAVTGLGDFNGDGVDDFAVAAYLADPEDGEIRGETYVVYGGTELGADGGTVNLGDIDGLNGVTIVGSGVTGSTNAGFDVEGIGDVNSDGFADILIGAPTFNDGTTRFATGASYVVFGSDEAFADRTIDLGNLSEDEGFAIFGDIQNARFGENVASAGDFNGDGIPDLAIGIDDATVGENRSAGEVFVLYGRGESGPITVRDTFEVSVAQFGTTDDDEIDGTGEGEIIDALSGDDMIDGAAGDDTLYGNEGADTVFGGAGDDTLYGDDETEITGSGNDTLLGGAGGDSLFGGEGMDTLIGDRVSALDTGTDEGWLYLAFRASFDRDPDAEGYAQFLSALRIGELDRDTVLESFISSDEFQNGYGQLDNFDFVAALYRNVLEREGDTFEIDSFATELDNGASRGAVLADFIGSPEFADLRALDSAGFATNVVLNPAEGFVFRAYQAVLGREPDAEGFTNFVNALQSDARTIEAIVFEFAESDEFAATYGELDDAAFIELLYDNVLPGNEDPAGRAAYIAALENDEVARIEIVLEFVQSFEFREATRDDAANFVASVYDGSTDDVLDGGAGNDMLLGGRGNDVFVVSEGTDRIFDFTIGEDTIDVSGLGEAFDTVAEIIAVGTQSGADAVFDFGAAGTLELANVLLADLSAEDFGLNPAKGNASEIPVAEVQPAPDASALDLQPWMEDGSWIDDSWLEVWL